jgi:hypothetical protein
MWALAAAALLAVWPCAAFAASPQETMLVTPPASQPKAEEKTPPYYTRSNPFAPLSQPDESKERMPPPPTDEAAIRPDAVRTPAAPGAPQAEDAAAQTTPRLNGILLCGKLTLAIVNDSLVKADDLVGEWRITSIAADTVTAEREGVRWVMTTRRPVAQPAAAAPAARTTEPAPPLGKDETPATPKTGPAAGPKAAPAARQAAKPAEGEQKP